MHSNCYKTCDNVVMYIFSAFLLILGLYCLKKLWEFIRILYYMSKFDGPKLFSVIFGNWNLLGKQPELMYKEFMELSAKYNSHWAYRVFNVYSIVLYNPEDCEIFMSTSKHTKKSLAYRVFINWLRDGLLLSSGEKWSQRRKILTPAFHFTILKDFIEVFNDLTEEFLKTLSLKKSEEVDVVPLLQEFSLLAIKETALGVKTKEKDQEFQAYRKAVAGMEEIFNKMFARPWLAIKLFHNMSSYYKKEKKLLKVLQGYTETIIRKKMDSFDEDSNKNISTKDDGINIVKKKKHMAMLDILLQAHKNGNQIDYEGICEEVDTFTFEGHDTVSTAMSFCLMTIANHPEIQDQILEEINSVLGDENRRSTFEDLNKMELLDRCIKESLRLYPSVHVITRDIDEDTVLSSGLVAPKSATVNILISALHRNPKVYPNPDKFDPDRFLPENCQSRHPFAYIPFSAGPRNCIGQRFAMLEMKVLLSAIIKNYQLSPVDTPQTIDLRFETILRTSNGIRVKFVPRI